MTMIKRILSILLVAVLVCSCFIGYDGYSGWKGLGLSHKHPVLSWESQSFQLTSEEFYYVYRVSFDDGHYIDVDQHKAHTHITSQVDADWIHWSHREGDDYATVSIDENGTGKARTACLYLGCYDIYGQVYVTQEPRE